MANTDLQISKESVVTLSQALSDAPWYAAHRLAAWEVFQTIPMPSATDDPWRRTPLTGFKWAAMALPRQAGQAKVKRVPAALTKPLAGKMVGGQLVWAGDKIESYQLDPALQA